MALPVVLLIPNGDGSCSTVDSIVSKLKGIPNAPLPTPNSSIGKHNVHLATKYYDAEVQLCCLADYKEVKGLGEEYLSLVEAVVLCCGANDPGLDKIWGEIAQSFESMGSDKESMLHVVVCDTAPSETAAFDNFLQLCLGFNCEYVELRPSEETLEELTENHEKYGIERLEQILSSHSWPNLVLKCDEEHPSSRKHPGPATPITQTADETPSQNDDNQENPFLRAPEASNGVSVEGQSFDELFHEFHAMKVAAQKMPEEDRKKYAERVTVAFWEAMGGDANELDDLSDSD